ncbi:MAG: PTS sugar transporter subunit IIC, partial [Gemmatimonadota bacterium]
MSIEAWLLAAWIGGVLGMDAVSFPQVMVARPLVAGTLGGCVAGEPALGLWVGAILEIVCTRQIPLGGARYHDTGPAAFAAGLAYAEAGASSSSLLLATAAGLLLGWAGSWTVHAQRRLNERLVAPLARAATAPGGLVRRHLSALGLDFLRATLL